MSAAGTRVQYTDSLSPLSQLSGNVEFQRKRAYRWLLYKALLDIRPLGWMRMGWRERLKPAAWRDYLERVHGAGVVADWLHNLAIYSALDFDNFDEKHFWESYDSFLGHYPNIGLTGYRDEFESQINETKDSSE